MDKKEADRRMVRIAESVLAEIIEEYEAEHGTYDEDECLYDWEEWEDEEPAA